ncbi:hypothetical protein P691DRAFT_307477 [Macrolepiota fuliginosa MF-IS2]|uniref:Uncharacterized protein n=1 Tax=Macrolepiota fuliginosa MF-IS2 TaxID=1400762 RepID=A0A9P5XRR0_9AGAR|nr:hypothetical protein P691DRAFT_307477 [Macrolepiota fuliginosa MF-IS2]
MSHRSKSSAKLDSSQSEPLSYKRTKRLRIESDEDEDGYEQHQERRTSYNESYTRGGAGSNSPDPVVATKKPRLLARGSVDDEQSDSDAVARVYDDPDHDEYDGYDAEPERQREASYDEYEGRRGGKRSSPAPSSPPQMESSPLLQPQPPLHPPAGLTAESSSYVAPATGGRVRRMSLKAKYMSSQGPAASTPTIGAKGKGKQKAQRPVGGGG